ncbi:MAG: TonB-dependent receptor [Dysgonamonadaceae bacterium]|jgi:TonB-linked SusC/RagA family outer membrane protein|nr:TonB-dependent receptor [Dysgonamonadaceae bacterium]
MERNAVFKCCFLILLLSGALPGVNAQNTLINLRLNDVPVEEVINRIEDQSDYRFLYNKGMVNVTTRVSIAVQNENIKTVLDKLFQKSDIAYLIKGKQIVLSKAEPPGSSAVTGFVADKKGEPVIGASVKEKSTGKGAVTNIDGQFKVDVLPNATLVISYLGYKTQEIAVGNRTNINVQLDEDAKLLDEVVVIGYGSIRKSDLTGAVASVKMNELNHSAPTLESALVGHTPGVEIKQTSGAPGSGTTIRVRGVNSVYSGVEPLYVIDGYPASKDVYINPSDVASIEVLKDAASAAIYGSRAAGGVVLITTKRGKEGKPKVELGYQYSVQNLLRKIDMMNSEQLLELHKDGYNNAYFDMLRINNIYGSDEERWAHSRNDDNATRSNNGAGNTMLLCPQFFQTDIDTDWQDALFSSAPMHRVNFNVTGGKEGFKYMFSLAYLEQRGIIKPSNHERITSRFNMDIAVNERFSIGVNSNLFHVKDRTVHSDGLAFNDGLILNALGMPPMYPVYREDGSYLTGISYENTVPYTTFGGENPVALAVGITQRYTRSRYAADVDFKYTLIDGLYAKVSAGMQVSDQIYRYYRPGGDLGQSNYALGDYVNLARASNDRDFNTDGLLEATLNFNRKFNKHTINAIAGYSLQRKDYDNVDVDAQGFTSDRIQEVAGAGPADENTDGTLAATDRAAWALMSTFMRAIYNYDERYTVQASIRGDGCSRFGPERRWGYFPSVSGGWNISNESFWEDRQSVSAKLRASWGVSGNNNISNYRHIPGISSGTYNFGGATLVSYYPSGFTDLKLGWEKTKQTNIGLDLGFFDRRLNLIANYYHSVTTDLLYQNTVSVITGSTSYWTNLSDGEVYNRGFDFQADASLLSTKDFRWNLSANISFNRNRVEGLKDEIIQKAQRSQITHITRNGLSIGSYYGMVAEGLITGDDYEKIKVDAQHQGEAGYQLTGPAVADYAQVYIGDVKWKDVNGNGIITEDDRDIIGNNYPDFSYGLSTSFSYKNWTLSAAFDGQYGGEVINFSRYYICNMEGGVNTMTFALDRYRDEANPGNGLVFRANRVAKNLNTKFSTYFVEDGSFFRCTNLTLGYTVPQNRLFRTLKLQNAYLYTSVDNLFMLTDYLGYNPDVDYNNSVNITPGVDFGTYPLSRTWSIGVNLTF